MKKLVSSLLVLTLIVPAQAVGADAVQRLDCQEDTRTPTDPFKKMLDRYRVAVSQTYPELTANSVPTKFREDMLKSTVDSLNKLCKQQKTFNASVKDFETSANEMKTGTGNCDLFKTFKGKYDSMAAGSKTYSAALKKEMEKLEKDRGRLQPLENEQLKDKPNQTALGANFTKTWGVPYDYRTTLTPAERTKLAKDGLLSGKFVQIQQEEAGISTIVPNLETMAKGIADSNKSCGSWGVADPIVAADDGTRGKEDAPGDLGPRTDSPDSTVSEAPSTTDEILNSPGTDRPITDTPITEPPVTEPPPTSTNTATSGIGNWMSENKTLLIVGGAGAAAVGGLLIYKNQQDKKADQHAANLNMDAAAVAAAQNATRTATSTSTSTGTGTHVTPWSERKGKRLIARNFPTSAEVGRTVTTIEAYLVDENGVTVTDDGVEIRVECTDTCNLSGTTRRLTNQGKVYFTGLVFNDVSPGIQLRVSAEGIGNSVASPSSFVVR